jgi:type IV pilus assembly protein PilB
MGPVGGKQVETVDLHAEPLDAELVASIPVELMLRYAFLPLQRTAGGLRIAIADPGDLPSLDALEDRLGTALVVCHAAEADIEEALRRADSSGRVLDKLTEPMRQIDAVIAIEDDSLTLERLATESSPPIIRLLDTTILNAIQRRASDIHIERREDALWIKHRIDGVLYPSMDPLSTDVHEPLISRLKIISDLDIAEKRVPQDGRFKLRVRGRSIDFRVSIMPSVFGEAAVVRILDKEYLAEQFSELRLDLLGLEGAELAKVRKYIREPYGMFLVTGPTGSGKTTTLYAALSEVRSEEDKIITIEDPVEYQLDGILQIPVNEKKGLTFARGLRSILRHDPDKIMVGEIRDPETAHIAVQSALTGHLVFTTVHANNVVDVIGRLLNMGVEPYNFVSALNCVLAQRLVRVICPRCKEPVEPTPELLEESGLAAADLAGTTVYEGAGCAECFGTGFQGRTCIAELLDVDDEIREMVLQRRSAADIKRLAMERGMVLLRDAALARVRAGETTLAEINKVTFVK